MTPALQKELAFISGTLALLAARRRSALWTGVFTAGASALYLASLRRRFDYLGSRVYITGGSRGLGLSLAWNALQRGAQVTLVARDEEELSRAQDILLGDFPEAQIFIDRCDVTDPEQLRQSISAAIGNMGGIDLLINNAGSILVGPFRSMTREDFEAQLKLHVLAVVEATQLVLPHFRARGQGRILNVCSLGGKVAVPHMLPYDTSKFALAGFSQGVAAELAMDNIFVTTAYPTVMRTGSPIQAVFKGDHEREFEWFAALDNMPLLSMSADAAAKKMLDAVVEGRTELLLSLPAKARNLLATVVPETVQALMAFAATLLPRGESQERKTGGASAKKFDENPALKPLRERGHRAEDTYNQVDSQNPEFNLGLH